VVTLLSECRERKELAFPNEARAAEPRSGSITERMQGTKVRLHYRTSAGNKSSLVLLSECRERKLKPFMSDAMYVIIQKR
jgi:hypothetical protein